MENWEKVILQFIRTLKQLRQSAGLESVTQVGNRTVYRVDSAGITANLVRIENLLKFITEHYLVEEEEEEWTVEIYSLEDIERILMEQGIRYEPLTEEEAKEIRELETEFAQNI